MTAREKGHQIGEALTYVNFYWSMDALVRLPAMLFQEYAPDGNRQYERGQVVRQGSYKYLLQGDGKLDPGRPLSELSLLKLFRDSNRYEWVREEYCIRGFERSYNDIWYRVKVDRVDSATPPPNDNQSWEVIE